MLKAEQVKQLIKQKLPDWVEDAREESVKYCVHINGDDVEDYLKPLDGWENKQQEKARKQFVTSNRFLFENIIRPIDKVFSATGGKKVYPKNNKKILDAVGNIRHGYSVKRWIQNVQANKYYTDPNGIVFFEWDLDTCYPTIKTIDTILNYDTSGRNVNWIIFEPEEIEGGKLYRVVDEAFDYTYQLKGESLHLVKEKTFKNPFGRCPAIVNSDIMHFELDRKDSPFAPVIELADHYLRTGSVKNIYEHYHGYPIFWAYGQPCKRCHGEGSVNENGLVVTCPSCDGSGNTLRKDVTDVINLRPPDSADGVKLAPDIAGYVQPDLNTWREQRTELDWLWQQIHFTVWGTSYQRDQQTATATFIDAQPVNDRLSQFSQAFEDMEQKMTELIALYYIGTADNISINWGKRFLIESPDAIWNKYISAKQNGAPKTTLDYLLNQFYQAEYANDSESLVTAQKMIRLEPFIHLTEKEVKDLGVTGEELQRKIFYGDWVKSLPEGYVFVTDIKKLEAEFEAFVSEKQDAGDTAQNDNTNLNEQDNAIVQGSEYQIPGTGTQEIL